MEVTGELGQTLDKQMQVAENEVFHRQGGKDALKELALKMTNSLGDLARAERDEGKFNNLDENGVHAVVQRYLKRAFECCDNLAQQKQSEFLVASGKAAALREAVGVTQRFHDTARSRCQQLTAAVEEATPEPKAKARRKRRKPGEHPGESPLEARRAEAKKANGVSAG